MERLKINEINKRAGIFALFVLILILFAGMWAGKRVNWNPSREIGQKLDSLNGVMVYYNGGVGQSHGRNLATDGYNLGIQYQCVEFVKRYYYQHLRHKMPDAYGHAKDFFNPRLKDGELNSGRGLVQFANGSNVRPQIDDLLVWKGSFWNRYGHVAIVAAVSSNQVEIVQQNPGPFGNSRATIELKKIDGKWHLSDSGVLGWLRMP